MPDVKVEARQALDKARELALRAQRQTAPREQEKRRVDYLLEELAAQHPAPAMSVSRLQPYTGRYGPLTIYLAGNKLRCKNIEADNLVTGLRPIAPNRFVLDDNAHVEFVQDSRGMWSRIKLYVSDGNVFEERRKGLK